MSDNIFIFFWLGGCWSSPLTLRGSLKQHLEFVLRNQAMTASCQTCPPRQVQGLGRLRVSSARISTVRAGVTLSQHIIIYCSLKPGKAEDHTHSLQFTGLRPFPGREPLITPLTSTSRGHGAAPPVTKIRRHPFFLLFRSEPAAPSPFSPFCSGHNNYLPPALTVSPRPTHSRLLVASST